MLHDQVAARRYALSLFQLCHSEGGGQTKPQRTLEELKVFQKTMEKDNLIHKFFLNPTISKEDKKETLQEVSSKLPGTLKFLILLVDADRMSIFKEIVAEFEKAVEESSGELTVELQVAQDLSEQKLQEIKNVLENQWKRKPKLKLVKNPHLLGGFVATASGKSFDASLQSQLAQMEQALSS